MIDQLDTLSTAVGAGLGALCTGVAGLLTGFLKYLALAAYDWMKPLNFIAEDWRVEFGSQDALGQDVYKATPEADTHSMKLSGKVKFFHGKSNAVALHRPAIEFTSGRWPLRKRIHRADQLSFGPAISSGLVTEFASLSEFVVEPNKWFAERLRTFVSDWQPITKSTAWFVAETVTGKKKRWPLMNIG